MAQALALADALDALLPQTQCTRCGYAGCKPYAEAMAAGTPPDRCPPGGPSTLAALAARLGVPATALDPGVGAFGPPKLAVIDEAVCIGCAKCLPACPVDAIVGARRFMHTVIAAECSGCELCVPACPVDCIAIVEDGAEPLAPPALAARAGQYRGRIEARAERKARDHARRHAALERARGAMP